MIDLCCGEEVARPKLTSTAKTVAIGIISVCTVTYCIFVSGNLMSKRRAAVNPTLQTLVQCVKLDRFEWADYALPYVINAMGDNVNPYVRQQADAYAERLAKVNSNTIPIYLAEYYFATDRPEQGIEMVEKYVDYVASDQSAWNTAFSLLRAYADDTEAYRSGIERIAQKLETWNEENIGHVEPDDNAKEFLAEYFGQP